MDSQTQALPTGARVRQYRIAAVLERPTSACLSYLATEAGAQVELVEYLPATLAERRGAGVQARAGRQAEFARGRKALLDTAAILAGLEHPSLMRLLDAFEAGGTAYLVSEHVLGPSLAELLGRSEPFDEARLKSVLLPLVDALECAHDAGVLHGNLEPGNVVLRGNGAPVLLGFGGGEDSVTPSAYVPIERCAPSDSDRLGPWTDIYALGAVAYRLIRGQPPPEAPQRRAAETLQPALQVGSGRHHRSLLQAVDWALRLEPDARPRNLALWKEALLGVRRPPPLATRHPPGETPAAAEGRRESLEPVMAAAVLAPQPAKRMQPPAAVASASPASAGPIRPSSESPATPKMPATPAARSLRPVALAAAAMLLAIVVYVLRLPSGAPQEAQSADDADVLSAEVEQAAAAVSGAGKTVPASAPSTKPAPPQAASKPSAPGAAAAAPKKAPKATGKSKKQKPAKPPPADIAAQKRAVAALAPRLHGKWVAKSSYDATGRSRSCEATVQRSWLLDFAEPSADGRGIDGTFKTRFSASGHSESCSKPRYYTEVSGVFSARPTAKGWQLLLKPGDCRGDCEDTADLFDYRALERAYALKISAEVDRLEYAEGRLPVALKPKTFLFW